MTTSVKSKVEHDTTKIPETIVQALHLKDGEELIWQIMPDGFITVRAKNRPASSVKGILPKPEKPVSIEDMRMV